MIMSKDLLRVTLISVLASFILFAVTVFAEDVHVLQADYTIYSELQGFDFCHNSIVKVQTICYLIVTETSEKQKEWGHYENANGLQQHAK
ncbi:MAG: hypothetical protein FWF78_06530 [Defluviitaleaceae bacterium]|nr:hypothetical protein [Defluviitaleaceae bacterium]